MKTINDINIHEWYMDRQLQLLPSHFVKCENIALSDQMIIWIKEELKGRYTVYSEVGNLYKDYVAFEDPSEALYFNLKWS